MVRRSWVLMVLAWLLAGVAEAGAAPPAARLAAKLRPAAPLAAAVDATREVLARGGVSTVAGGRIVERATKPAASFTSRPIEAVNLAVDARQRGAASRISLAELARHLDRLGFPFGRGSTPEARMVRFLRLWVRAARKRPRDTRNFTPLFLAAWARRQRPSLNLAKGNYSASQLRLGLLEVELIGAAFFRSARNPPAIARARVAQTPDAQPCSGFKDYFSEENRRTFGQNGKDVDKVLEFGLGTLSGAGAERALTIGLTGAILRNHGERASVKGAGKIAGKQAGKIMLAMSILLRAQKLAAFYDSVYVDVRAEPESIHKPIDRQEADRFAAFGAFAGVSKEDLAEIEAEKAKLDAPDRALEKAGRDCLKTLGLPSLADAGSISEELKDARIKWSLDRSPHAKVDNARSKFDAGVFRHRLTPVPGQPNEASAVMVVGIASERAKNHTGCQDGIRANYVTATASLEAAQPPSPGTLANALSGIGVLDSVAEAMAGLVQSVLTPSGSATLEVTSHIRDPALAGTRTAGAHVCRAYPPAWTGTASGQFTQNGLTTTWTATYKYVLYGQESDFANYDSDPAQGGGGTISWSTSGTRTDNGCAVSGSGTTSFTGGYYLQQFGGAQDAYNADMANGHALGGTETGGLEQTCPGKQPEFVKDSPLKFRLCQPSGSYSGQTTLSGSRSYEEPYFDERIPVSCSWEMKAG